MNATAETQWRSPSLERPGSWKRFEESLCIETSVMTPTTTPGLRSSGQIGFRFFAKSSIPISRFEPNSKFFLHQRRRGRDSCAGS